MKNDKEHRLQCACVRWFAMQYPQYRGLLFAVPNGGARNEITGARLKEEGVTAGVADLLLLIPNWQSHGLAIEMKTPQGRQSESQQWWQSAIIAKGYEYVIVRSLSQFIETIEKYLEQ